MRPEDANGGRVVGGDPIQNAGTVVDSSVETTQIAATILTLLGLDPKALKSVQIEHTAALPLG